MKMRETSRAQDKKLVVNNYQNNGSRDGDSPAAYRYTECKLSKAGEDMLADIKKNAVDEKEIYSLYYDKKELIKYAPSHRILAMNRGENEGVLKIKLEHDSEKYLNYNVYKKVIKNINADI